MRKCIQRHLQQRHTPQSRTVRNIENKKRSVKSEGVAEKKKRYARELTFSPLDILNVGGLVSGQLPIKVHKLSKDIVFWINIANLSHCTKGLVLRIHT